MKRWILIGALVAGSAAAQTQSGKHWFEDRADYWDQHFEFTLFDELNETYAYFCNIKKSGDQEKCLETLPNFTIHYFSCGQAFRITEEVLACYSAVSEMVFEAAKQR